jgi:hypothetical protein
MDFNKYWIDPELGDETLKHLIENHEPIRFYVGILGTESFTRPTKYDIDLNNSKLELSIKMGGYIFEIDNERIYLERHPRKGFSIREDFPGKSCLDYVTNREEYLKIYFNKKADLEPTKKERAEGIPFYKIKKH